MRFVTTIAAATMGLGLAAGTAQAAPSAMLQSAVDTGPAPQIELVRGGCGWGAHRSWYGHCHYNHGWRGRARWHRRHWY